MSILFIVLARVLIQKSQNLVIGSLIDYLKLHLL
jgi:hypothetical protein